MNKFKIDYLHEKLNYPVLTYLAQLIPLSLCPKQASGLCGTVISEIRKTSSCHHKRIKYTAKTGIAFDKPLSTTPNLL